MKYLVLLASLILLGCDQKATPIFSPGDCLKNKTIKQLRIIHISRYNLNNEIEYRVELTKDQRKEYTFTEEFLVLNQFKIVPCEEN